MDTQLNALPTLPVLARTVAGYWNSAFLGLERNRSAVGKTKGPLVAGGPQQLGMESDSSFIPHSTLEAFPIPNHTPRRGSLVRLFSAPYPDQLRGMGNLSHPDGSVSPRSNPSSGAWLPRASFFFFAPLVFRALAGVKRHLPEVPGVHPCVFRAVPPKSAECWRADSSNWFPRAPSWWPA